MMQGVVVMAVGFLAQAFFSARILVQWIMSERAHRVLSPTVFWALSIAGSYLLCLYGWMRDDFAIVLGQFISYYIYLYNLKLKGAWAKAHILLRLVLLLTPVVAICAMLTNAEAVSQSFFRNDEVPLWLLLFGSAGQVIFTLRFIYQWLYSRHDLRSVLPTGFWIISLTGSLIIAGYAIMRLDPVLIVGQSFGIVAYIRNLIIGYKQRNEEKR